MTDFQTASLGVCDDCPSCGAPWPRCRGACVAHDRGDGLPGPCHNEATCEECQEMNPKQMPAGREMDQLVAESVMGQRWQGGNPIPNYDGVWPWPPPYSTDPAAALAVIERIAPLCGDNGYVSVTRFNADAAGGLYLWQAEVEADGEGAVASCDLHCGQGDTAALAICRLALLCARETPRS